MLWWKTKDLGSGVLYLPPPNGARSKIAPFLSSVCKTAINFSIVSYHIQKIRATLSVTSIHSLIVGCQFGIQLYDWDGSTMIHSFDFQDNGIGVDGKLVTGGLVKGKSPPILKSNKIVTIK